MKKLLSLMLLGSLVTASAVKAEKAWQQSPVNFFCAIAALYCIPAALYCHLEVKEARVENRVADIAKYRRDREFLSAIGMAGAAVALTGYLFDK